MSIIVRRRRRRLRRTLYYTVLPVVLACLVGVMAILAAREGRAATPAEVTKAADELLVGIDEAPTGLLSAHGGYDTLRVVVLPPEGGDATPLAEEIEADAKSHTRRIAAALRRAADGRYRILDYDVVNRLEATANQEAFNSSNLLERADIVVVSTLEEGRAGWRVVFQAIARSEGDLLASASLNLSAVDRMVRVQASSGPQDPPTIVDNSINSEPIADNSLGSGAAWHGKYRGTVVEAQERLWELGYDPGPVTGALNDATREALRAYQRDSALPVTGRMTRNTMENMRRDTRLPGPLAYGEF